jgi:hypothetical protein
MSGWAVDRSCRDLEQECLPASFPIAQIREPVGPKTRFVWHAVRAGQVSRRYSLINTTNVRTISICYYRTQTSQLATPTNFSKRSQQVICYQRTSCFVSTPRSELTARRNAVRRGRELSARAGRQRLAHRKFLKTRTGHRGPEMREKKHLRRGLSADVVIGWKETPESPRYRLNRLQVLPPGQ